MTDEIESGGTEGVHLLTVDEMPALIIPNVPPSQIANEDEVFHTLKVDEMPRLPVPNVPSSQMFRELEDGPSIPNADSQ